MAGTRGGLGRLFAMAMFLTAGLLLALAAGARGEAEVPAPIGIAVAGGEDWRDENDFDVFWRNPVGLDVVGANWRIDGSDSDYEGEARFTPGADLTELADVQVPSSGWYRLHVWLRDRSGWESSVFSAAVNLRFDGVAPALSFLPGPGGGAMPPLLVAAVADPLSGLASGTISYRRADEEHWNDLPSEFRDGPLGTELVAATPALPPGVGYAFRAEAVDAAGNVAETTERLDGTQMTVRDGATPGRPAHDAAPGGRPTRIGARLVTRGGRHGTRLRVDLGDAVLLRGQLRGPGGEGLSGERLRVQLHPVRGGGHRRVEHLVSGRDGGFRLRLPAGPSRRVTVSFAGGGGLAPSRRALRLSVRAGVTLRARPTSLRTGDAVELSGRVRRAGTRISRAGKLVTISYFEQASRRWRPAILTRTDRGGRFEASYRFRYVSGRALIRLRATAPAEAGWAFAAGSSPPVRVEVSG
jgi:hypothetical protein